MNENNVDLNRNYLTKEQFNAKSQEDPNRFQYMDFNLLLNPHPDNLVWYYDLYWFRVLYNVFRYGFTSLKRTLVSGTYSQSAGLSYGGMQLQPSFIAVEKFLSKSLQLDLIKRVAIIDVHTGLGRSGEDTLILDRCTNPQVAKVAFDLKETFIEKMAYLGAKGFSDVVAGYEEVYGSVPAGVAKLFPTATVVGLCQEFGTVPATMVFQALRWEQAMTRYAFSDRKKASEYLKEMFYLSRHEVWQEKVTEQGVAVFTEMNRWLNTDMSQRNVNES